jgi:diguanylate cyclase (GGDEF)-like protein
MSADPCAVPVAADVDAQALLALRLLPDEPGRAMQVWAAAHAQASAQGLERTLFRLHVVQLNYQARFGDAASLPPRIAAAEAVACDREWMVEWLLLRLLVLFLATLGTAHVDGLRELDAIRPDAEAALDPIELSWLDLMAGHFLGYLRGWAEVQQRAYQALGRLVDSPDAPPGLVANLKKNIGYSHLLVQNLDLARVYLEDAWRAYGPLPLTPRKLSAVKAWAQCLLVLGETDGAARVIEPVLARRAQLATPLYLASALLVAAEIALTRGEPAAAAALLHDACAASDAQAEPAIEVHAAYVRALLLADSDVAGALAAARTGCAAIGAHTHEVAVQSCLDLAARLSARVGDFEGAYALQGRLVEMRADFTRKAAQIRHIDLHVDLQTRVARLTLEHAERERAIAEAAERAILERNALLEQRLREVERLQDSLREQANRDALTGLYNRRYLAEALPGLLSRAARAGGRIALVLIDLDHFKEVNDRHGHLMGDVVLRGLGEMLLDSFRAHDVCCRWGGEEFCVVMTDTDDAAAKARVEELLVRLGERVFVHGARRLADVAFSAGIVSFAADPRIDIDEVFRRVDQALYVAKNAGRRRIAAVEWA